MKLLWHPALEATYGASAAPSSQRIWQNTESSPFPNVRGGRSGTFRPLVGISAKAWATLPSRTRKESEGNTVKAPVEYSITERIAAVIRKFDDEDPRGLDGYYRDIASYYHDIAAAVVIELGLSLQWAVRIGADGAACVRDKQAVHQLAGDHPTWRVVHRVVSEWATGG
jgi:hypothetical protein